MARHHSKARASGEALMSQGTPGSSRGRSEGGVQRGMAFQAFRRVNLRRAGSRPDRRTPLRYMRTTRWKTWPIGGCLSRELFSECAM